MTRKLVSAYSTFAKFKAVGVKTNSKLGKLLKATNGDIDLPKYIAGLQVISKVSESKNKTRQENVTRLVNKMTGLTKSEKLLLMYLSGYKVDDKNEKRFISLLRNNGMSVKAAKDFLNIMQHYLPLIFTTQMPTQNTTQK